MTGLKEETTFKETQEFVYNQIGIWLDNRKIFQGYPEEKKDEYFRKIKSLEFPQKSTILTLSHEKLLKRRNTFKA